MTNAWDAAKAVSNLEKHGVAFEAADAAWLISLRKANRKEAKHYGKFIEA